MRWTMSQDKPPTPLDDLGKRLSALRREGGANQAAGPGASTPKTAGGWAFRLSVEMVAGLVVGGGMGWLLDRWLGTSPVCLLVFFLLGAAAGTLNVFRTAKEMNRDDTPKS
ncbi:ATP synthase protein I [Hypericibacter terrae]|uniref:ATP synthase protein I n=2 Tax=Hypericibacter terrae TaxID=2602015 RepID=A0A5J6MEE9_9PROT|nr:ATP synthase protein I [Hypericibacter terrae]